jgi:hypothetical protein
MIWIHGIFRTLLFVIVLRLMVHGIFRTLLFLVVNVLMLMTMVSSEGLCSKL